ncbi:TspO/MBR family protein [Ferruginibacter sp. SUN106]|uniref:TspO/MBR family protein n=1 Tax=Ferruginibacter sp. SUN106 TaxID=2978348 RepID=UPI003D36C0A5
MKLIISILIPLLVGGISGYFTASGVEGWYAAANKPWFNPPNWIFAPVWTVLYILMGIALYLVWKTETIRAVKQMAIILFAVQLALNFFWSLIFFKLQQPGWAFAEIIAMWVMIVATILWFGKISSTAAWLMVPYICWVSFASVLNYAIWKLN